MGLADGGWIVTWQSPGSDGTSSDIFQQRFNPRGLQSSHETRVNTTTASHQDDAQVTSLKGGGWVVTWTSFNQDGSGDGIYQQRYSSSGQAIGGETRVNTTTNGFQSNSSTTGLADGGWVVTWSSERQDGSGHGIYQQRYNADGDPVGVEVRVNHFTAGHQSQPSVTALRSGGWLVTWVSEGQDGSAGGVYQQRYSITGAALGHEVQVNTTTVNSQWGAKTIGLSDGGWVVVWYSYDQDGDMYGIYQQRYAANGQTVGGETRVNTTTYDDQNLSSAAALPDGGWVVTWTADGQDGSGAGVYQQRFNKDGQKIGPTTPTDLDISSLQVNEGAAVTLSVGTLSTDALVTDQGFTYTLLDDAGGRFEIVGDKLTVKDGIRLDHEKAQSHTIKVRVTDGLGATFEKTLTIAVADVASENLVGSSSSDMIKGGQNTDIFYGVVGNDMLWGGGGSDKLYGGLGNDQLAGETGKDMFVFDTKTNKTTNVDRITDFNVRDDSIWLENKIFTKLGSGTASKPKKFNSDMLVKASKAQDAEDRIIYDKSKGVLYYDADGTGSKAQVKIATLSKNLKMTHNDFFVI
jgi:Ca2+-binding RTX toxin-like protein